MHARGEPAPDLPRPVGALVGETIMSPGKVTARVGSMDKSLLLWGLTSSDTLKGRGT